VRDLDATPAQLVADAAALGVDLSREQAGRILEFGALLLRWNRAFNLVSRHDEGRLYARHLLDSLAVAPSLLPERVLDLGTGAGLPGIPLAIARRELGFTLIDRSERKIRVVNQAVRQLALGNVQAVCGDARKDLEPATFDTVVSRAVAPAGELWRVAGPLLRPGGRLLLMERAQGVLAHEPQKRMALPGARGWMRKQIAIPGLPRAHGLLIVCSDQAEPGSA
jgi:16S rRNA (guanine527-N7)-methyltransferase